MRLVLVEVWVRRFLLFLIRTLFVADASQLYPAHRATLRASLAVWAPCLGKNASTTRFDAFYAIPSTLESEERRRVPLYLEAGAIYYQV